MSRVASKPPLGLKPEKPAKTLKGMRRVSAKREAYRKSDAGKAGITHMGKVKLLPCCICEAFGMIQNSRTEVHHCKSGRYSARREIDANTIPLCHSHHNKLKPINGDGDKVGFHNLQESWEALYGPDYEFIPATRDAVDRLFP